MKMFFVLLVFTCVSPCLAAGCCSGSNCCPKKEGSDIKNNPVKNNPVQRLADAESSEETDTKKIIQEAYSAVVTQECSTCQGGGCCGGGGDLSGSIGYTQEELDTFADANFGLGCGHPVSLGHIKEGDVVLDLGSGAGFDCFLAARKVGPSGKVIGVDMTDAMIQKAQVNAKKYGFTNVEFRLGDIELLPVESDSIDVIMSNCVINLAPQKHQVFKEAGRVLKKGGFMAISDVVLLKELTEKQKKDTALLCACVSGALLKCTYLDMLQKAGFAVTIIDEDLEINKKWFDSDELPISSLKFVAYKK